MNNMYKERRRSSRKITISSEEKLIKKRLSELWKNKTVEALSIKNKKYIIVSDTHLGDGGRADDLRRNEHVLVKMIKHYCRKGYSLILLGDIEELWQFDMDKIITKYKKTVYREIKNYGSKRMHRICGNHDNEWKGLKDPILNIKTNVKSAVEAIKIRDKNGRVRIILVHGHQGSTLCDKNTWFSRFLVRAYGKYVEPRVKFDKHSSATKSQVIKGYEKILYSWAKEKGVIIICGHTHRAIFESKSHYERLGEKIKEEQKINSKIVKNNNMLMKNRRKRIDKLKKERMKEKMMGRDIQRMEPKDNPVPCYFNTGCALYTDGITAIEIDDDEIKLVKWSRKFKCETYNEGYLSEYIDEIDKFN